jgi:hypothetical protein
MDEIWKDIKGYEWLYQVSNFGRVKSLERSFYSGMFDMLQTYPERIMKRRFVSSGYEYVGLSKDGIVSRYKVHRLVAEAFIPNLENKPQIDHINAVRSDNRAENLRWCTQVENMNNPLCGPKIAVTKIGDKNPMKKRRRMVLQIDPSTGMVVATHIGTKNIAGFDSSCISRCCNGVYRAYRGYLWRYAEPIT